MLTSIIIFALTYVLISGRRLRLIRIGRPAGVIEELINLSKDIRHS